MKNRLGEGTICLQSRWNAKSIGSALLSWTSVLIHLASRRAQRSGVAELRYTSKGRRIYDWGVVKVPSFFHWKTLAHELGHTFGLRHDHRDPSYVMSYRYRRPHQLSACAAGFLSVHFMFNPSIEIRGQHLHGPIGRISPARYPPGSESVKVSLRISNPEGLHQVFLYVSSPVYVSETILRGADELAACRYFSGERSAIVEFDYHGRAPSNSDVVPVPSLANPTTHKLLVRPVDTSGRKDSVYVVRLFQDSDRHIATLDTIGGHSLAFSPNGSALAYVRYRASTANIRDLETGKITASFGPASPPFWAIAISPDGTTFASEHSGTVKLWDVATGNNTVTFEGNPARRWAPGLMSVAFSPPDGAVLAVQNGSPSVKLWDLSTNNNYADLEHDGNSMANVMAFSPTGTRLVTGFVDGAVKQWDVATGNLVDTIERPPSAPSDVAFSPDGATLAIRTSWYGVIELYEAKTSRRVASIDYVRDYLGGRKGFGGSFVAFSPDGGRPSPSTSPSLLYCGTGPHTPRSIASRRRTTSSPFPFLPMARPLPPETTRASICGTFPDVVTPVAVILDANLRAAVRDALGLEPPRAHHGDGNCAVDDAGREQPRRPRVGRPRVRSQPDGGESRGQPVEFVSRCHAGSGLAGTRRRGVV